MDFDNVSFPQGGIMGRLRNARRLVGANGSAGLKRTGNKRHRAAVRAALKGHPNALKNFTPSTAYDLS